MTRRRALRSGMTWDRVSRRVWLVPGEERLVRDSAVTGGSSAAGADAAQDVILELIPVIRRVVAARVRDFQLVDDLVQETLARVMAARDRIEQGTLAPVRGGRRPEPGHRGGQGPGHGPGAPRTCWWTHRGSASGRTGAAAGRSTRGRRRPGPAVPQEREVLLAHEVDGAGTAELAAGAAPRPGAIAAQLNRTRAKLRVEYLLADTGVDPADRPVPAGAVRVVRR